MEFGKFATAEELLKGYNELEKSFTQKCQQLSAAEKQLAAMTTQSGGTNVQTSPLEDEQVPSTTVDSAVTAPQNGEDATGLNSPTPASEISDTLLQQYLESNPEVVSRLLQQKSTEFVPNIMNGGGNVSMALPSRPKTIKEASLMALQIFNK